MKHFLIFKRNDIIITKADKGGAVVILDIKDYIDETNRQLNDTNNYELRPTELHTEKIKSEINNLKNENLLTLRKLKHLSFIFFRKYIPGTIQEGL